MEEQVDSKSLGECDECENQYYLHTSKMANLCLDAHIYYMATTTAVTNLKIADVFTVIGTEVQVNI